MDDIVAVALAAWNAARLDAADLTAARFLREVLQEQRGHGALETHVDLGHGAVGQGFHPDAEKRQTLVERGDVGLTVRQPVDALRDQHIEALGLGIRH